MLTSCRPKVTLLSKTTYWERGSFGTVARDGTQDFYKLHHHYTISHLLSREVFEWIVPSLRVIRPIAAQFIERIIAPL